MVRGMDAAEQLRSRAHEYELLAAWHEERAPFSAESAGSAVGFLVAAIVMREVANAIDDESRWAA
jgi:hypothetical protein